MRIILTTDRTSAWRPCSGGTVFTNTSGHTVVFTVEYVNDDDEAGEEDFDLDCSGTKGIMCSVQTTVTLAPGFSDNVTVTFATSSQTGLGQVFLSAQGTTTPFSDSGSRSYTIVSPVSVAPTSVPGTVLQYSQGNTGTFEVTNDGSTTETFLMTCDWSPGTCEASPASTGLASQQSDTVTVTFQGGQVPASYPLSLTAAIQGTEDSNTAADTVAVAEFVSVNVVADRATVYAAPSATDTSTFSVRFPGQAATSFAMSCAPASDCSVVAADDTISVPDATKTVRVQHTAGANGTTKTLTLTATKVGDAAVTASGSMDLVATSQILVSVDDANPELELMRSECVNIATGPGAVVCDDFQYVYPLTPVKRMNRTRQTGLIYNSVLRAHHGAIGVNVVLPPGGAEPDSLQALLLIDGDTAETHLYDDAVYDVGQKTRLAFNWAGGVSSGTRLVPYTVEVKARSGGVWGTPVSASGHVISLEKRYVFGRGWWLAGYEHLTTQTDATLGDVLIWTGGDVSTRVYVEETTDVFVPAADRSHPDTIFDTGTNYERKLFGGGKVVFDTDGTHLMTIARNGRDTTTFSHSFINSYERPTAISLPTRTGSESVYELDYEATHGWLEAMRVRKASGTGWDTFTVSTDSIFGTVYWINAIQAPDGQTTQFRQTFGAMDSILGPRGDTTTIDYVRRKVWAVRVETDQHDIRYRIDAASTIGADPSGTRAPRPVEDVYTRLDGPFDGSSDYTHFYTTAWGGLRGVENALGHRTWIDRDDPNYTGLPTRVRHPNGWQIEARYNALGLPDTIIDGSTSGVTTYEWDTKWSRPTKVTSPEGVVSEFTYDSNTGNRTSQKIEGSGTTTYGYNEDHLLDSITDGLNHRDSLAYDTLGNLTLTKSPLGEVTTYGRDHLGRPDTVTAPDGIVKIYKYDLMGRVELEHDSASDGHWRRVYTTYDSVGQRDTVSSWTGDSSTDSTTTGPSTWEYDALGRVVVEKAGARVDTLKYDVAGNLIAKVTRRGHTIAMSYDALNRLDTMWIPGANDGWGGGTIHDIPYYSIGDSVKADTHVYTYDAMGNMLTANNDYARVTRTFTLDGLIASEEQAIREYGSTSFGTHVYEVGYTYGADRRRMVVHHPDSLSVGSGRTTYLYDGVGRLETITGPLGNAFDFTYDDDDRLQQRTFPGPGWDFNEWSYDADHHMTRHDVFLDSVSEFGHTINRDAVGRVESASGNGSSTMSYTGLGQVEFSAGLQWEGPLIDERFQSNGLGQQIYKSTLTQEGESPDSARFKNTYSTLTGALTQTNEVWAREFPSSPPDGWEDDNGFNEYFYDNSGNRTSSWQERSTWDIPQQNPPEGELELTFREESASSFSADDRLMFHQVNRDSIDYTVPLPTGQGEGDWGAFEEYWYDALGRRVMKRSLQTDSICEITDRCESTVDRYIWDGEQILWELRQLTSVSVPGDDPTPSGGSQTGQIGYIHGPEVDAPVGFVRNSSLVVPHADWRGLYGFATDVNGDDPTCGPEEDPPGCDEVAWPSRRYSAWQEAKSPMTGAWYGSLALAQRDESGLSYRRNRYYDPVAGQFTQTDPIGIAGGLNLYGYAGGDPINFSDPFGLRVCFMGTREEVGNLVAGVEEATGTSNISLGAGNCVTGYDVVEDGDDFAAVQGIFAELVAAEGFDAYLEIADPDSRFYSGTNSISIGSMSSILRRDVGGYFFRGRDAQGTCRNGNTYGSLGQVIGHELIGEAYGIYMGERRGAGGHTTGAIGRSNAVQRALGGAQVGC